MIPPKRHKHIQKTNASTCQQIVSEYLQEMCTNTLPPKRERNIKTWDGGALERTHYIIFLGPFAAAFLMHLQLYSLEHLAFLSFEHPCDTTYQRKFG